MNEDEIQLVAAVRPDAPPYDPQAKAAARRGLVAAAVSRTPARSFLRGPRMTLLAGALAVAVGATATALATGIAPAAGPGPDRGPVEEVVVALPQIAPVSASEVLDRAASAATRTGTDLEPRDDQFVKVESETMYGAFSGNATNAETGETVPEARHLYRTKRTIWQSADGSRDGSLRIEHLEPRAYPGWPIPEEAHREAGTVEMLRLPACEPPPDFLRTDYAALKRLPADAEGMRAHLYEGDRGGNSEDEAAWTRVGDMLRENYLPAAQRAALFQAAATIPGVDAVRDAEDAAGRRGIGVGRVDAGGIREDLVFDPATYELLGERGIVVDEKLAKSPEGSLVASTAQLSVTVADEAPAVDDDGASGCG
ncbi:CU044_5270 family protein [Planomonospora sp. ID67723]|uniref:CU044_5270 family protein n=1 Tax=Planomonospora sp. ID67723 TaxID=2738134 RepID=UPI0018C3B849|nr:CU044_5270 family protein [Planomonospora sp. ID67723]MBG0828886.1 CU044_5270 family protein [Planomonospora sp. ID67723]